MKALNHVMAMTAEGLHSKSSIAMELGHRDRIIDELKVALRVATIIIEDRVQIPNDAPFMEKARELVGYKKAKQMSIDEVMDSLFAV
jgi:hypothetical protein